MEELLQQRLYTIFDLNKHDRNVQFLKELGLNDINIFTKEIMLIYSKESDLSAKNRNLMSRIYFNLYRTIQAQKEIEEKKENEIVNQIEACPEGGEGEIIKVK